MLGLTPGQLFLGGVALVALHVIWGLLSQRWHPLWLLIGVFLLVETFSRAIELPGVTALKYFRVYITALMLIVALWSVNLRQLRGPLIPWLLFCLYFFLAALYSDYVLYGLFYKGLFLALALSGAILTFTINSLDDLNRLTRLLLGAVAAFEVLILIGLLNEPGQLASLGRAEVFGINPNSLGLSGALALPLCLYSIFYDKRTFGHIVALPTAIIALLIVLLSGSRGAVAVAVIGSFAVFAPLVKSPKALVAGGTLTAALTCLVIVLLADSQAVGRLDTWSLATRQGIWAQAWHHFAEAKIFGHGWISIDMGGTRQSPMNLHSIYLQVLASTGLVGMMFFVSILVVIGNSLWKAWRMTAHNLAYRGAVAFGAAYVLQFLAHGFVETVPLFGSTRLPIFMTFGIGLSYSIPRLLARDYETASLVATWPGIQAQQPA
jgi:O-antigen ligase